MTQATFEPAPAVAPRRATARFPCFDGLRALAALAVFAFHSAGLTFGEQIFHAPHWVYNWLSRLGLFGVATFFVISGFLLYRPFAVAALTDTPAPTWLPFWKRRFFRIFPAYWVALAATVFVLGQHGFPTTQEALFHFSLLQNYRWPYLEHGLGVAWTLCIEISFYIALPVIALALRALGRNATDAAARIRVQIYGLVALAAVAMASRAWWMFGIHLGNPPAGTWFPVGLLNYWLPSYLDWFALGMAMALGSAWLSLGGRVPAAVEALGRRPWLSWLLALGCYWLVTQLGLPIFVDSVQFSATQDFIRFAVTGLAAAFFVLPAVFGPQRRGAIRAVLRHPVLVALGLVSYGIYLWHFPIWDEIRKLHSEGNITSNAVLQVGIVLSITIVVAALSYVVIERPIIFWSSGRPSPRFRDLKFDRADDPPPPNVAPSVDPFAARRVAKARVVIALGIVVIAVGGLLLGTRDLSGGPANASGTFGHRDTFSWRGSRAPVWDDFSRPAATGLGATSSGQHWVTLSGTWSVRDHRARAAPEPVPSFAVVPGANGRTDIRATVGGSTTNVGVAFRCQDAQNCWFVGAQPGFGTWAITKVIAGQVHVVANIGVAPSLPGTSIAVHSVGDQITVAVNGTIQRVITDPVLSRATGVGLARGPGGSNEGQWRSFESG